MYLNKQMNKVNEKEYNEYVQIAVKQGFYSIEDVLNHIRNDSK